MSFSPPQEISYIIFKYFIFYWFQIGLGYFCALFRPPLPHKGSNRIALCEYGKGPTRQFHRHTYPLLSLEWPHQNTKYNSLALSVISRKVGTRCRSVSYERFFKGCSSTVHATRRTHHGASRLAQAMSVWLVKTRRASSRHSRDARVCGRTTTTMHKLSTPPPLHCRASCASAVGARNTIPTWPLLPLFSVIRDLVGTSA